MKITEINFVSLTPKSMGVCAEAVITLDDAICIHHLRVIQGKNGLFVAFPNSGFNEDEGGKRHYRDIVHPKTQKLRSYFERELLRAYRQELKTTVAICDSLED